MASVRPHPSEFDITVKPAVAAVRQGPCTQAVLDRVDVGHELRRIDQRLRAVLGNEGEPPALGPGIARTEYSATLMSMARMGRVAPASCAR